MKECRISPFPLASSSRSFPTSAYPQIAAKKAFNHSTYTLLLVYSLLYVLTISWCVLFQYAPSLALVLASRTPPFTPHVHSPTISYCARWLSTDVTVARDESRESKLPFALPPTLLPFPPRSVSGRLRFARSRIVPDCAAKINLHEVALESLERDSFPRVKA